MKLADSDDSDWNEEQNIEDVEKEIVTLTDTHLTRPLPRAPLEGEYVIVQLVTKKQKSVYIGKVLEGRNDDFEYYISFLQRKSPTERFQLPDKPDLSVIREDDIKFILPNPTVVGSSSRPFYVFPFDLSSLKIC